MQGFLLAAQMHLLNILVRILVKLTATAVKPKAIPVDLQCIVAKVYWSNESYHGSALRAEGGSAVEGLVLVPQVPQLPMQPPLLVRQRESSLLRTYWSESTQSSR